MSNQGRVTARQHYETKPWLKHYSIPETSELELVHPSTLATFRHSAAQSPDAPCLIFFDAVYSYSQVDELSDALAVAMDERSVKLGDRVALMMQNVPQFVLAQLAIWKIGGIYVPLSPMFKQTEIAYHLEDSGAEVLFIEERLYRDEVEPIRESLKLRCVVTISDMDMLSPEHQPPVWLRGIERYRAPDTDDMVMLMDRYASLSPPLYEPKGSDIAILSYTSGTTGRPKGAMNTHRNIAYNAEVWSVWAEIGEHDVIAGIAPLFHITGPPGITGVAFARGRPVVLTHRFDAQTVLESLERHKCTFALASITVFLALMESPRITECDLSSFSKVFSGGAPVPSATVARWQHIAGSYIHNCYGLTETNSPTIMVPLNSSAPVDPDSGALAIGVPTPGTTVRVVDPDSKADVMPGATGEFWIRGPGVVPGYWERPDSTAEAMEDDYFRTGDIGIMDADGWFYAIDRSKDMIIASGFKVWPREVEDGLYLHAAVREAAVIGIPDSYRGETVKAFVSLRHGQNVTEGELIEFCRKRMAAYKYPRSIVILDELPKTASGKFLRRELREHHQSGEPQ